MRKVQFTLVKKRLQLQKSVDGKPHRALNPSAHKFHIALNVRLTGRCHSWCQGHAFHSKRYVADRSFWPFGALEAPPDHTLLILKYVLIPIGPL